MNLKNALSLQFTKNLVSTPEGRAHILHQVAEAEANGEIELFDSILRQVDDPVLQKMVRKHQADEIRHEKLFRECYERQGVDVGKIPDELQIIDRVEKLSGGALTAPIVDKEGVMRAYVMLQVIEERAMVQYELMEKAFRPVDPQTADVFAEIRADETRHLKYCKAISRKYAPSEEALEAELARLHSVENRAFDENSTANIDYVMKRNIWKGTKAARWFWRSIQSLMSRPATEVAAAA